MIHERTHPAPVLGCHTCEGIRTMREWIADPPGPTFSDFMAYLKIRKAGNP